MKAKSIYLMIGLLAVTAGCKKETFELPTELVTAKSKIATAFDLLNQNMAEAVINSMADYPDTALIRTNMVDLVKSSDFVIEFSWITPAGIMQIIEPSIYYGTQGTDISGQEHIIKCFQTRQPVLSKQFFAVEGFYASVVIHPVVKNNTLLGGITALFYPEQLLENELKPIFEGKDFEIWVMEKGGKILYDQDAGEIGRNLFTDPSYSSFPDLLTAGNKIDTEDSGKTSYSYYKTGTNQIVNKLTYWNTFELFGTQWKIVWVQAQ